MAKRIPEEMLQTVDDFLALRIGVDMIMRVTGLSRKQVESYRDQRQGLTPVSSKPRRRGRPSKNPGVVVLADLRRQGLTYEHIAQRYKVCEATVRNWYRAIP